MSRWSVLPTGGAGYGTLEQEDEDDAELALALAAPSALGEVGLGCIVALHHHSPTSHQIHEDIRCLHF
jgi:hypothetical protein